MTTKRIRATYLHKQATTLRSLANLLEGVAKLIDITEVGASVARSENAEAILDIGEYYNSLADNLEAQGVDLIGVKSYVALTSSPKRKSASPASRVTTVGSRDPVECVITERKPPRKSPKRTSRTH